MTFYNVRKIMVDKAICMCSIETSGEKMHKFDTTPQTGDRKIGRSVGEGGVAAQTI